MLKRCYEKNRIENYLNKDFSRCLYIYLDYQKYGLDNENVCFFEQIDNKNDIVAILLLYYNSGLHIYSKDNNCDYEELKEFIYKNNPSAIFAQKNVVDELKKCMNNSKYLIEYGRVWEVKKFKEVDKTNIKIAQESDFDQITNLLMEDEDISSSYTFDGLKKQLIERNKEGYSRNYVIKENGKVIAHTATGIETNDVAVSALTIVDINHRRKGLATLLLNVSFNNLHKEGKKVYLINYTEESSSLYVKMGCEVCCEWGKLYN